MGLHRYAQALAKYAESAYVDRKAAAQMAKADEGRAVGLHGGEGGHFDDDNDDNDNDSASDDDDIASLDERGNPKPKERKKDSNGDGSGDRPQPSTLNVASLTANFIIDPQDILWFSHCDDVAVRAVDTAFEAFLVRQKDELAISAEVAQTVGDELIRIIKHAKLRGSPWSFHSRTSTRPRWT